MEGSAAAYERLLLLISERLPEVAEQVRAEVGRGVPCEPTGTDWGLNWGFETYAGSVERTWRGTDASSRRGTDVSSRAYSADERLTVLVAALRAVAATTLESRQALGQMFDAMTVGLEGSEVGVTFLDPVTGESTVYLGDSDLGERLELAGAVQTFSAALDAVRLRG